MTVKDLIDVLQKCNPDLQILLVDDTNVRHDFVSFYENYDLRKLCITIEPIIE